MVHLYPFFEFKLDSKIDRMTAGDVRELRAQNPDAHFI